MSMKVMIPPGQTEVVINGLYQWDYGRSLEIIHDDLPAEMEIHFAATDSKEAIVHVVPGINGIAMVAIPNVLLEQPLPITAWVYRIGDTIGKTIITVTMPIQPRPRPAAAPSLPDEISDKYTEALGTMNTQIEALKQGNVKVASANQADSAGTANLAIRAGEADKALGDKNGNDIATTYQKKVRDGFQPKMYFIPTDSGLYQFRVTIGSTVFSAVGTYVSGMENVISLGPGYVSGTLYQLALAIKQDKTMAVYGYQHDNGLGNEWTTFDIWFRQI